MAEDFAALAAGHADPDLLTRLHRRVGLLPDRGACRHPDGGLDEWGYPILKDRSVPGHLRTHARRAAAACPRLAFHLDAGRR